MSAARRPRIGLITTVSGAQCAVIEILGKNGEARGYTSAVGGLLEWGSAADFTPLAEVPAPRMAEPQETWATVVASTTTGESVHVRWPNSWWECSGSDGLPVARRHWSDLIDPRPTTPTERATGIVGGEDQ